MKSLCASTPLREIVQNPPHADAESAKRLVLHTDPYNPRNRHEPTATARIVAFTFGTPAC